jgi:predicted membrane-bound spermidine synthase
MAGFVLLPALGLVNTVRAGVAVNALVFVIAAALSRAAPRVGAEPATADDAGAAEPLEASLASVAASARRGRAPLGERVRVALRPRAAWILPLMLVSGATSFLYEVLWTRLLVHVLGGSIYAFTTMLATFLTGIALGSGLAGRLAASRRQATLAFAVAQLGIAALAMGVYAWLGPLIPAGGDMLELVAFAAAVMLPATLFIGATFPLAVRVLARDEREASAATARVYAWNTQGGIAGAVLAAFWIIPGLGFEGSIRLAVCGNALLALLALLCVEPARPRRAAAAGLACLAILALYHPPRPQAVLAPAVSLASRIGEPRETFYAVGRSATVLVVDDGESYRLLTNGLLEADVARRGSPPALDAQKWLTALAVAARPDLESMLVVGFGGGVALGGLPASVRRVDVVELEPEVIRANRALAAVRAWDPLADPRVHVILNDARNALRLTRRRYDAIVSQPSHPSTAGASHLFTQEFVRSAKSRLNERGVFVQWMTASVVTPPLLRSLAATLLAEFRSVRVYRPSRNDLLFVASDAAADVEREVARSGRPIHDEPQHFYRLGLASVEDLLAALVTDPGGLRAFAGQAPVVTDDRNLMATHSHEAGGGLTAPQLDALFAPYDPLLDAQGWVRARARSGVAFPHLARQLMRMGKLARASALARVVRDDAARLLIVAELHANAGDGERAARAARAALEADPRDEQARYFLLRQQRPLERGPASAPAGPDALAGLEGSALATARGWQLADAQSWSALAELDATLARSRVTDLWYPDAMLLRARWRLHATSERELRLPEALRLIDAAWLLARDLELALERLRIGAALGDDAVLLESARYLVSIFGSLLDDAERNAAALGAAQRALLDRHLSAVVRALDREFPPQTRPRAEAIAAAAREALRRAG